MEQFKNAATLDVKLIRTLHTCDKCDKIVIRETNITESSHNVILSPSLLYSEESSETCLFYRYLLTLFNARSHQPEGQITVQFEFLDGNNKWIIKNNHLRIYSFNENGVASGILPTTKIHTDVQSPRAFTQVKSWINECYSSHRFCADFRSDFAPTRLLDVGTQDDEMVRLVGTEHKTNFKWTSLSYVWGGPQDMRTTKRTLLNNLTGIQVVNLPQTLVDAINVCRQLEIPFLWIDALCIIQDDLDDLNEELTCMPSIYQHSFLTILASRARRVQDGFLGKTIFSYDRFPPTQVRYVSRDGEIGHVLVCQSDYKRVLSGNPIASRAWTFQEALLSLRSLHYTDDLLQWSCRSGRKFNGNWKKDDKTFTHDSYDWNFGDGRNSYLSFRQIFQLKISYLLVPCVPGRPLPVWEPIVESYSRKRMTKQSDRLIALSAIAKIYAESHNHTYLAGLWKESLPLGLCWKVEQGLRGYRPKEFRAPSWSWASTNGPVRHVGLWWITDVETQDNATGLFIGVKTIVDNVEVIEAKAIPKSPGTEYFSIQSASLTLKGPMRLVSWDLDFRDGIGEVSATDFECTGYADAWENNWPDKDTVLSYNEGSKSRDEAKCTDTSSVSSDANYGNFQVFAFLISKSRDYNHGYSANEEKVLGANDALCRCGIPLTK